MGQANKRGTREERIALQMGLIKRSIEGIKKEQGIPPDAECLGYGVHLEKSDEFLADFQVDFDATSLMWVKTPEMAKLFDCLSDAYDVSLKCSGSVVVCIFDCADQMWVSVLGSNVAENSLG